MIDFFVVDPVVKSKYLIEKNVGIFLELLELLYFFPAKHIAGLALPGLLNIV